MRNNQAGFSVAALCVGLVLAALVGFTYYRVQQADERIEQYNAVDTFADCVAAGNPVMESYPEQCAANGQTFSNPNQKLDQDTPIVGSTLRIPELGVQFDVPAELATLYYYQDPDNTSGVYFSLEEFKETDCAADEVSLAALSRATTEEIAQWDAMARDELPFIGGYYYISQGAQAECSEDVAVQQKAGETRKAILEAIEQSLRADS